MVPAVAVKFADEDPAGTITEAGTLSIALLLESDTIAPPAVAGCAKVTVQVEVLAEFRLVGSHATLFRGFGRPSVMFPPVPLAETLLPSGAAATTRVTPIGTVPEAAPESVTLTTATVPFAMALWLSPATRQVEEPLPLEHVRDLDAAPAAAPFDMLTPAMLAGL
jgi:hypothetical protein